MGLQKYLRLLYYSCASFLLVRRIPSVVAAVRVITPEELAANSGKDTSTIWLAVCGKVYDVTAGVDHYGTGGQYEVFAGRDAIVPFVSGVFTPEEAAKSWKDLTPTQLPGMNEWISFYDKEDKYPFLGHVVGNFYDAQGNPTAENKAFHKELKIQTEIDKAEKAKARAERKAKAAKEKAEKETARKEQAKQEL